MADLFLSYSREDIEQASSLARCLTDEGWTVFWDRHIPPGKAWADVLDDELTKARCVVVLWTSSSVKSDWVQYEARQGRERQILIPARGQAITPPAEFNDLQAADLIRWSGVTEYHGYALLIAMIRDLIGARVDIRLTPSQVALVTGERAKYPDIGPTINMTCTLSNDARQPVVLNWLELLVTQNDRDVYKMEWYLLYDTAGPRHIESDEEMEISVEGKSSWSQGVQFREPRRRKSSVWIAGNYDFELLGRVNRRSREDPNIITRFRGLVTPKISQELKDWRDADAAVYDELGDPDRAAGSWLEVRDIREGL